MGTNAYLIVKPNGAFMADTCAGNKDFCILKFASLGSISGGKKFIWGSKTAGLREATNLFETEYKPLGYRCVKARIEVIE